MHVNKNYLTCLGNLNISGLRIVNLLSQVHFLPLKLPKVSTIYIIVVDGIDLFNNPRTCPCSLNQLKYESEAPAKRLLIIQ